MWPEVFRIALFGRELPLRSFGLFVAVGFLFGVWWGTRLARRYGADPEHDPDKIPDLAFWVLIGVLAGGRLGYVLVNLGYFIEHPIEIFEIWKGGLVMYGGLILAVLLGIWKGRRLKLPLAHTADYCVTAGFLGQAIGRFGCLAVGDDYGSPTDGWWAIRVPDPLPEGSLFPPELAGMTVHPTQLYMSLKAAILFALGMALLARRRFAGQVACVLGGGYAVLRFVIEWFRWDAAARGGIYRDGLDPESVGLSLHGLGVAEPNGRITDIAGYQELLRTGVEGTHPELLLSTSQMVSLAVLPLCVFLYWRLSRRSTGEPAVMAVPRSAD